MSDSNYTTNCRPAQEEPVFTFTNFDCPSRCNQLHPAPPIPRVRATRETTPPLRSWQFTCPTTNEGYMWCHGHEAWLTRSQVVPGRFADFMVVGGRNYCNPTDHGFERCRTCSRWFNENEMEWSESYEYWYCSNHFPSDYDYDRDNERDHGAEDTRTCRDCNSPNLHMDFFTEEFICDCTAEVRIKSKIPVLMNV